MLWRACTVLVGAIERSCAVVSDLIVVVAKPSRPYITPSSSFSRVESVAGRAPNQPRLAVTWSSPSLLSSSLSSLISHFSLLIALSILHPSLCHPHSSIATVSWLSSFGSRYCHRHHPFPTSVPRLSCHSAACMQHYSPARFRSNGLSPRLLTIGSPAWSKSSRCTTLTMSFVPRAGQFIQSRAMDRPGHPLLRHTATANHLRLIESSLYIIIDAATIHFPFPFRYTIRNTSIFVGRTL